MSLKASGLSADQRDPQSQPWEIKKLNITTQSAFEIEFYIFNQLSEQNDS